MRNENVGDTAFAFGPFRLIPRRQILESDRGPLKLGARALDILYLLLERAGEQVSKDALLNFAWPDVFVDQANLKVHISSLRRVLKENSPQQTYIATIPGHGYQFVARVDRESVQPEIDIWHDQAGESRLPPAQTLVGRERDLQAVGRALEFTKFITLVGPGGVGKSSLAIAVAHAKQKRYSDGVYFVDLADNYDPALVPRLIASGIGVRLDSRDCISNLCHHLKQKCSLIVIDNCDHMLHSVAAIVAQFLHSGTHASFLITSREPLGLSTEHVQRLEPLSFPKLENASKASDALMYPAIRLFASCALQNSGYRLVDHDVSAVVKLCGILDGLPLAIQIAATRLNQLSPNDLLVSVNGDLDALSHQAKGVHIRHHSLRQTLDWSYQLLSPEESMLFCLLSVFGSSFEWADVVSMAGLPNYVPCTTTLALGALVAKSLIFADLDNGEQLRYRMMISARQFASEHLKNSPFWQEAHRQHAMIILSTMEKAETEWSWVENTVWRARYIDKALDLREALDWCFGAGGDPTLGISLATVGTRLWNGQSSVVDLLPLDERGGQTWDH